MVKSLDDVTADFDAIAAALADAPPRSELTPAERALLQHVPPNARVVADVGCGDGVFTRALARRGLRVWAIDVSPRMIELARARTPRDLEVQYHVGDFMREPVPTDAFDAVVSINMVHHVVLSDVVPRLAAAVAPGGTLLIQDVVTKPGLRYLVANVAGALTRRFRNLVRGDAPSPAVSALYERHGRDESYLKPADVEAAYRVLLPGVRIEHHLEWRYSAIWLRTRH